ncbi:MAG: cyanophycin synthetase [Oscillatoriales cyanobacterium CG2_30_44_21]|nr:MAG: cyanophycin synthetase [Oscillatoriales cyanobacterium CG2_30_44_21]
MKILKIQTLRGPNFWSIQRHQLVVVRLDLEDFQVQRTSFYHNLCKVLPSFEGGTLAQRSDIDDAQFLAEVVKDIAIAMQGYVGMKVDFGKVKPTVEPNIYQIVFEYKTEGAGRYAARAAVRICTTILDTGTYATHELQEDLKDLRDIRLDGQLGPSTESIVAEAKVRNIPWLELGSRAMIQLGYGVYQSRIQATLSNKTGILAVELACDKEGTKSILRASGIPVPRGTTIRSPKYLEDAIAEVGGFPIVIKPLNGNHGRGITIDVVTFKEALDAFDMAQEVSEEVIIERFHTGRDHRILVINGKFVAVAERVPANVTGDGVSSVSQLIEITNQDPRRGDGHDNVLTRVEIDRTSMDILAKQGFTLESVPPKGQVCYLKATANLSTGGVSVDRTDEIHPENIWLAERTARIIGLDIAGIDMVTEDISKPVRETDGAIVEVNAAPGFRMHTDPSIGKSRNVAAPVIEMLFPAGAPTRVPIVAITGTNGKTTTTRLTAHIFKQTSKRVGYTTTDGIYIGECLVEKGDTTGPYSAQVILRDPTVEVAILETARGGILRSGLGFDGCDVGVVMNVQADHLGIGDIDTIEDLARLKSTVVKTALPSGFAILNAEDPLVVAMTKEVQSQIAYFSMNPELPLIKSHVSQGGLAAVYEDGYLTILKGDWKLRIEEAVNVPLTLGGRAAFNIQNALAASLAAFTQDVQIEQIRQGLATFIASSEQTPGRMNLFDLGKYHALVDYAHNPAGFKAIADFIKKWEGDAVGVIGAPGDRRDEDIIELGQLAAKMFSRIFIKEDKDLRGREPRVVADLLRQGVQEIDSNILCITILDESEAIIAALDSAPQSSLVVVFPDKVDSAIAIIEARKSKLLS